MNGAFGFIGCNLSSYFKKQGNYKLIALDIDKPQHHSYDLFYTWDQLNEIEWDQVHTIIHLAGKTHNEKNQTK